VASDRLTLMLLLVVLLRPAIKTVWLLTLCL
jgi:hypothetical protein